MSNNNFLNKKGQYYERPSFSGVHPVLIIGIIITCTPIVLPLIGINMFNWISGVMYTTGIITILVGGMLSIMKSNGDI